MKIAIKSKIDSIPIDLYKLITTPHSEAQAVIITNKNNIKEDIEKNLFIFLVNAKK